MTDLKDYRRALGRFPTGVITIVTAIDGDHKPLGLIESYTHHPTHPLVYYRGSFFAAPHLEVTI